MNDYIEKNYYEILDLIPGAEIEDIHKAYQRSLNTYDADSSAMYSLLTEEECKAILDKVEEAYSVIGDIEKKIQYDSARGFAKAPELNSFKPQSNNDFAFEETTTTPIKETAQVSKTFVKSKFALTFTADQAFETEIENCTSFTGDYLKSIREYKNVSIERMADLTKVSKTHLRHIEEDMIEKLPAAVYTRGFVFQYAKCLKLNPEIVSKSYMDHTKELRNLLNE